MVAWSEEHQAARRHVLGRGRATRGPGGPGGAGPGGAASTPGPAAALADAVLSAHDATPPLAAAGARGAAGAALGRSAGGGSSAHEHGINDYHFNDASGGGGSVDDEDAALASTALLAQIHDELLFECPADERAVATVGRRVAGLMAGVWPGLAVPLTVKVSAGARWGSMAPLVA